MYTHVFLITLLTPCCMSDPYVWFNDEYTHMCYWDHYLHHGICQITMQDIIINVHTCFTDSTTYAMLYIRSLCLVQWWMDTHVVLITLLEPRCMSAHHVRINDKYANMFYWWHFLHHGVCHITLSDSMMNIHTCFSDNTGYALLYVRSLCQI